LSLRGRIHHRLGHRVRAQSVFVENGLVGAVSDHGGGMFRPHLAAARILFSPGTYCTAGLPVASQFCLLHFSISTGKLVLRVVPTFLPQRSLGVFAAFSVSTKNCGPVARQSMKSAASRRELRSEMPLMMKSARLVCSEGISSANGVSLQRILTPSRFASSLARSISSPTSWFVVGSRYSMGA